MTDLAASQVPDALYYCSAGQWAIAGLQGTLDSWYSYMQTLNMWSAYLTLNCSLEALFVYTAAVNLASCLYTGTIHLVAKGLCSGAFQSPITFPIMLI